METEEETFGSVEKHAITEDDGERITPEKKGGGEDSRKAGKQPVSRIPTFQSSMARKRPTSHSAEPSPSSAKMETSVPQSQSKEKGSTSGETKLPLYGARDTALPIPFVRLTPISTDALSRHDLSDHIASPSEVTSSAQQGDHSPDANFGTASDTEELQTPLGRPAIRAESRSHVTDGSFDSDQDYSSGSESVGKGLFSEDVEREPHDDKQVKTNLISISSASDDAMKMGFEYSETIEHCDETDDEQTEKEAFCLPDEIKHEHDEDEKLCLSEGKITEENSAEVCSEAPTLPSSGSHLGKFNKASVSEEHLLKHPKTVQKTKEKEKFSSQSGQEKKTTHSPSSKRKGKGFAVFCLFPTILLLLVGFGQHIWLYGIPKSVSHLMIQLELHWLEGFWMPQESCSSDCRLTLVESIPEGLVYTQDPPHLPSIAHGWRNLLYRANSSVDIAAFYFTLRDSDLGLSLQGEDVFRQLMHLESTGVNLKVAVNDPQTSSADTDDLAATGAEVRAVDLRSITGGIIHTKLWVVDKKHMYMGSANMDWRSLTQVKELGVSVEDCSCLAQDASRIFGIYWDIGAQKNGSLPPYWPGRFSALSSSKYPLVVKFNGVPARVYLSSAPPALSAYGRTDDLSAILTVIADAKQFISISVMDYLPFSQFIHPPRFWPAIDSALREAACARDVEVNLLVSCWPHSPSSMFVFLQSLMVLSRPPLECKINVKIFRVPSTQEQSEIPFARVNHAKYMVTDRVAYIGTSNWSENYFTQTAGVGLVINQTDSVVNEGQETVQSQLHSIFQRDWTSDFAETLSDSVAEHCSKRRQP